MAFTKITNAELNAVGATTQPNVPTIGATALKQVFDAPAKQVVAPKVNNLIDELQASTAAADLGAVAPTGRTGTSVQSVLNSLSSDLGTAEAQSHAHPNKAVIDKFADDGTGLTYDGNPIRGAVESVNGKDGTVVLTASDVGALPSTTAIPTKTSDLTNDSGFITASSLPTKTSQLTNDSGFITSGDIPTIPSKTSDLTNDSNFVADASYVHTDNNYDATAKTIVDGATAAIAAKSTVAWNQNITTGQKIATVTIDGTPTDVYAPTGGGGGGGAVDSVNGQTGIVTLGVGDIDDVSISSLGSQQTIVYDGTEWGNEALADVALSGSYNDLSDKPTIPAAQVNADWNANSGVAQILNKPTIPTVDQTYNATSSNAQSGTAVASAISGKADIADVPTELNDLSDVTITGTPSQGETLIADANGVFKNQQMPQGGHTMIPTPSASLTEDDVVTAINAAKGTNENVPSLFSIREWTNEKKVRRVMTGTTSIGGASIGSTGIGTWDDSATPDESTWWQDNAFKIPDNADDIDLSLKFDPSSGEPVTLGGYILDTTTGKLCIKFGNSIATPANAKIAVDITYTRNEFS